LYLEGDANDVVVFLLLGTQEGLNVAKILIDKAFLLEK
jgi:hypothetical protein